MKIQALISILVFATLSLNAQETTWVGTHRLLYSTDGIGAFNPQKSKTFCQLTNEDGQLSGWITRFGEDVRDISHCTENLKGTIGKQIERGVGEKSQYIEWKSVGAVEDWQKKKYPYETVFRGMRDGDTIVGYFEQTWSKTGKAPVIYRGIVELNREYQSELMPTNLAKSPPIELANVAGLSRTLEEAKARNKIVILNFTGSDWCVWCAKFDADVLSKPEFATYAATNLTMVLVDFPKTNKQSDELKKLNAELRSKCEVEGFPSFVVFNSHGTEIGRQVGYMPGGPQAFIAKLEEFKKEWRKRNDRD